MQDSYQQALHYVNRFNEFVQGVNSVKKNEYYTCISNGYYFFKIEQAVKQYAEIFFKTYGKHETVLTSQMYELENKLVKELIIHVKTNDDKAMSLVCSIINHESGTNCIASWKNNLITIIKEQIAANKVKVEESEVLTPAQNELIDKFMKNKGGTIINDRKIVENALKKGLKLSIFDEGDRINLNKTDRFVVGCNAASNRSQVLYRILDEYGCKLVLPPIAGGISGMNPTAAACYITEEVPEDNEAFQKAFGVKKVPPLGAAEFGLGKPVWGKETEGVKAFYQKKIDELVEEKTPLKVMAFHQTVESFIFRIAQTNKPLDHVEIIFCNVKDPVDDKLGKKEDIDLTKKVFLGLAEMLKKMIHVS